MERKGTKMMGEPDQVDRPGSDAVDAFTDLQKALLGSTTLEQFLKELATLAARLVTDGVCCGMTMRNSGRPGTVACSDPLAREIDEVQYRLDDGPCLHAMRSGDQVSIDDTAGRVQWPRFEAAAQARGIRSCLALPLVADGKPVGALNLYARGVAAFGAAQVRQAENLAENASGALSLMLRLASYSELTEQLRSSLTSRAVIYQALGVIMAQERCAQAKAFEILRTASQNSNLKLRDIAAAVVTRVSGEPPDPHPFEEDGE
ncbi:MAG: GAF and ANTAR domain-containing protein [Actinobacteria bacterium]|nr:GAF and ANTAR domain-containing protein [Actinomycetota bacterium]